MAIEFKKEAISGSQPAFWRGEAKILPGGFAPGQDFPVGTVLKRGLPLFVDFEERKAYVCKTALVVAGGTTTKVRVAKGHCIQAGDIVMKAGKDDVSPSVTSVDTSDAGYDVLNLSAGISGISEGDIVAEATAYTAAAGSDPAVPAAPAHEPNAVVGADLEYTGRGIQTIDAAYEAAVLFKNVAVPYLPEWVEGGMCLKCNHSVKLLTQ